jgi:hypothetical protein
MTQPKQPNLTDYMEQIRTLDTDTLQRLLTICNVELFQRPDFDCIFIVWHLEDIQERRPDLTQHQGRVVLSNLERRHDAGIGINWDVIDIVAEDLFPAPAEQ